MHLHQIFKKITIQDRHDIGEIEKSQIGLKCLSPLETYSNKTNKHKTN